MIRVLSGMCGIMRGTHDSMLGMMLHGIREKSESSLRVSQEARGVKEKRVQVLGVYSTV